MKRLFIWTLLLFLQLSAMAQDDHRIVATDSSAVRHQVLLQTTKGDIVIELYNETPEHRDNFLKLVKKGYYNGILWHRVIANFMIQTGDSATRHAKPGERIGDHDLNYTIPAEIVFPKYFHKRGAVAAAREGDKANPERKSSAAQFYIVYGSPFSETGCRSALTSVPTAPLSSHRLYVKHIVCMAERHTSTASIQCMVRLLMVWMWLKRYRLCLLTITVVRSKMSELLRPLC